MKYFQFLIFIISINISYAQVGIDTETPNSKTVLDVVSKNNDKGILIPRLSTSDRDDIVVTSTENGLTIYNTDENCFNYYQTKTNEWLSMCGSVTPSTYTVECSNIKKFGIYTEGTSLNSTNYLTLPITVTKAGTYHIIATTSNGYFFERSGVFPEIGNYTINLNGSGTPSAGPQNDIVIFEYDGVADTLCDTVIINVRDSQVSYSIACNEPTISGTYNATTILNPTTNTITFPLTNIDTTGLVSFTTSSNNGVNFSASETLTTSSTSITLRGYGTPTLSGIYTFTFTSNGANAQTCTFSVNFNTDIGTYGNPAERCLQIYNLGLRSDGEYFIKSSTGEPFKTYCDMSNGGFTMIRSVSEKVYFTNNDISINPALSTTNANLEANFSTARGASGSIIYEKFQIPLEERKLVRSSSGTNNIFRVRILEDKANVNNNNDEWSNNNYAEFNFYGGTADFITGHFGAGGSTLQGFTYSGLNYPHVEVKSKIFGKEYYAPNNWGYVRFEGTTYSLSSLGGSYVGVYNQGNPGNGFMILGISHGINGSAGQAGLSHPFTYQNTNGSTTSNDLRYMDQLWGSYDDYTFNHHWGKCGSIGADDYQGVVTCSAGATAGGVINGTRFPHSFNNGEGRYIQWFVK